MATFDDFEQYWSHFVREHTGASARLIDVAGLGAAALSLAAGLTGPKRRWLLLLAPLLTVGPALVRHMATASGDRPLPLRQPWWWLRADLRMAGKMLAGTMAAEVERCRSTAPGDDGADDVVRTTFVVEIIDPVEEHAVDPQSLN